MSTIKSSESHTIKEFSNSKLPHRHLGAIAVLVLISLLISWLGLPQQVISNCWEGFLWGMANPVIALDSLANTIAIGLLSSGIVGGKLIAASFVSVAILGTIMHLFQLNLLSTEIAIAILSITFGIILVMPNRPNWLVLVLLGAIAGLFQGYNDGQSVMNVGIVSLFAYVFGAALTHYAVVMSAREIGNTINYRNLPRLIHLVGGALWAIGILFLKSSIN